MFDSKKKKKNKLKWNSRKTPMRKLIIQFVYNNIGMCGVRS